MKVHVRTVKLARELEPRWQRRRSLSACDRLGSRRVGRHRRVRADPGGGRAAGRPAVVRRSSADSSPRLDGAGWPPEHHRRGRPSAPEGPHGAVGSRTAKCAQPDLLVHFCIGGGIVDEENCTRSTFVRQHALVSSSSAPRMSARADVLLVREARHRGVGIAPVARTTPTGNSCARGAVLRSVGAGGCRRVAGPSSVALVRSGPWIGLAPGAGRQGTADGRSRAPRDRHDPQSALEAARPGACRGAALTCARPSHGPLTVAGRGQWSRLPGHPGRRRRRDVRPSSCRWASAPELNPLCMVGGSRGAHDVPTVR